MSEKPREWWIVEGVGVSPLYDNEDEAIRAAGHSAEHEPTFTYHVIEKSAYDKLEAENKRLAHGHYRDDHRYHPLKAEVEKLEAEMKELRAENESLKSGCRSWYCEKCGKDQVLLLDTNAMDIALRAYKDAEKQFKAERGSLFAMAERLVERYEQALAETQRVALHIMDTPQWQNGPALDNHTGYSLDHTMCRDLEYIEEIAREALAHGEKGSGG